MSHRGQPVDKQNSEGSQQNESESKPQGQPTGTNIQVSNHLPSQIQERPSVNGNNQRQNNGSHVSHANQEGTAERNNQTPQHGMGQALCPEEQNESNNGTIANLIDNSDLPEPNPPVSNNSVPDAAANSTELFSAPNQQLSIAPAYNQVNIAATRYYIDIAAAGRRIVIFNDQVDLIQYNYMNEIETIPPANDHQIIHGQPLPMPNLP